MSSSRSVLKTLVGAVAVGTLLVLSACAPDPDPVPTQSSAPPTRAPEPEPYDGPLVFVGDELDAFALTPDEVTSAFPGVSEVGDVEPVLEQISDGGGPDPVPAICWAPMIEQSLWSTGARSMSWTVPAEQEYYGSGRQIVIQFADEAQAGGRMDQLIDAAAQCAQFDWEGPAAFVATVLEEADGVRALAGTLHTGDGEFDTRWYVGFASVGNVLVQVFQPFTGEPAFDADATAVLLRDRAVQARAALIEKLTATPPAAPEEAAPDATVVWSEWTITTAGIGSIRLGAGIDEALATVVGAEVAEPQYEGEPWKLTGEDGVSTLFIQPAPDGVTVASITAGANYSHDEVSQDGASLPAAQNVRVGSSIAEAKEAFPGGTTIRVVASGEDFYDVATREGRLIRFRADRDATDPAATIIGMTVEDATLRRGLTFG